MASIPAQAAATIDFKAITALFTRAVNNGRDYLFEYETYELLKHSNAETPPQTQMIRKGSKPTDEELLRLPGDKVVLKIVSPTIVHKTEVGGVKVVAKTAQKIRSAYRRMLYEIPEKKAVQTEQQSQSHPNSNQWLNTEHTGQSGSPPYQGLNSEHAFQSGSPPYQGLNREDRLKAIDRDIRGVLMVQFMPPDSEAFGNEMIVGIRNTREFGMVISAGLGGTDTELYAQRFKKGQAIVAASTVMTDGDTFFDLFRQTISYQKLAGLTRGQRRIVSDEQLLECFASFIAMANYYSPANPEAPFVIEELEINPFAFTDFLMVPLDGLCRFSKPKPRPIQRPYEKIGRLLHPGTIGLIGVSTTRMNYGRIMLNNILANGFARENIRIIRSGMDEFDGITCVPDLAALDVKLDLFVVAVGADKVPDLVEQIVTLDAAESVMLIPGGMGETRESSQRAIEVMAKINNGHQTPGGGPVFLGANCLGVISHPGRYDTLFIPDVKLPKQRGQHRRSAAFVSQSGAFMITRLSKCPELDPAYMISIGNQNDLTLGDMVKYLKDDPDIDVIGVYAEGFKDLDGLEFCEGVRRAVLNGKDVVFYKAGKTPEGQSATAGHTASLAGDYMVCESCVNQAGGIVAQTFSQFEDLLMLAQRLHKKEINGRRLSAISGAGFEAVGVADNIQSEDHEIDLARFSSTTVEKLQALIASKGLDHLVEVKNPLDINPSADDEAHLLAVTYMAEDPYVDAVVVGLDPLSPAMRTLSESEARQYSMTDKHSVALQMPKLAGELSKPVIGVVDGGRLYDPLVDELMDKGMAVFRSSDRAVQALSMYIQGRLYAYRLKQAAMGESKSRI